MFETIRDAYNMFAVCSAAMIIKRSTHMLETHDVRGVDHVDNGGAVRSNIRNRVALGIFSSIARRSVSTRT